MPTLKKKKSVRRSPKKAMPGDRSNGQPVKTTEWDEFIGMFKDDSDFVEVKKIMAENRKKSDVDQNQL